MTLRWLSYAQLLRLPNGFTLLADGLLVLGTTGFLTRAPGPAVAALLAGLALYYFGMVLNDLCDRDADALLRRHRPLPAGAISVRRATWLAVVLGLGGYGLGAVVAGGAWIAQLIWLGLLLSILGYNFGLKSTIFGPVVMGACRALHSLFGLALGLHPALNPGVEGISGTLPLWAIHLALGGGVYIVAVTWFARQEEFEGAKWELKPALGLLWLSFAGLLWLPYHERFASPPRLFPYLLAAVLIVVSLPWLRAIRDPRPELVQAAVRRGILGLIAIDAVLLSLTWGWSAALLLGLYWPAKLLARRVYST
jgi:4-hydroxybenzoate polyprenyltransferase